MKKTIFLVAALSALIAMFVGCSDSTGSTNFADSTDVPNNPNDPADPIDPKGDLANPIGTKQPSAAKAVGDIVFSDGSASPYTATLTAEQKSKAIAVIFYVGTGLNSGDDTTTSRTLGVGLKHSNQIIWCANTANGNAKEITAINCPAAPGGSQGNYTFTGDKNGSGNLAQLGAYLAANGSSDDTGTAANYPAFYFAKNYSTTATNLGSTYNSYWYLPSAAELFEIYRVRSTVNAAYVACDAPAFQDAYYWSSSQADTNNSSRAKYVDFASGYWGSFVKSYPNTLYSCAIRAFN